MSENSTEQTSKIDEQTSASQYANDSSALTPSMVLWQKLVLECQEMASFALSKGLPVPPKLTCALVHESEQTDQPLSQRVSKLTAIHNRLSELVSPAKPETIVLMAAEIRKDSVFLFLGKVPLIRRMMLVSIISLVILISLSLSEHINNTSMVKSMFDMKGPELLFVQFILMAAAAIGASFSALFKANSYVTAGSYDPKYESSYWVKFVVGLIAGIILTQLIPINLDSVAKAAGEAQGASASSVSHAALRITMALIGGFSANLVYKILDRIVLAVQTVIQPPVTENQQIVKDTLTNQHQRDKQLLLSDISSELNKVQQSLLSDDEPLTQKKVQALLASLSSTISSEDKTN